MKVKALVDFGGQYAMHKGSAEELPDNPVTRGLILGGFIEEVKGDPDSNTPETSPDDTASPESALNDAVTLADVENDSEADSDNFRNSENAEDESSAANAGEELTAEQLRAMTNSQLTDLCRAKNIEVNGRLRKDDLISLLTDKEG